ELTDVGEGDAEALLAAVLLGCENARARVSTGVGKVTEYEWHLDKNKEVLESESEY
ncbi:MAG: hypothetical protein GTO63_36595, partial [Anaerolineae bacterium]|nr:hypothetical protein [Anaerolineae bacterium]NIO00276.1 hypothetical protein [Anaerolineae bacterium]NIQ83057.1 hypothetical protein [Anaerolineae bacterium]